MQAQDRIMQRKNELFLGRSNAEESLNVPTKMSPGGIPSLLPIKPVTVQDILESLDAVSGEPEELNWA